VSSSLSGEIASSITCLKVLEGHKYTVWSLVLSPDGDMLYSGSADGHIMVSLSVKVTCAKNEL
jgi:WD40 repeat protein